MQRAKLGIYSLSLMALLFVAGSSVALAQVTATITGRIEDPAGAAVPGAEVTVRSLETDAVRTMTADGSGSYQILSLPVGRYEVKAEKPGFKAAVQTGLNLVVGQQAVVNLKMEVGAVQEQVTVTSDAPVVNTTTESVSGLIGQREVKELPLNGRTFDLLIAVTAGTFNYSMGRQNAGGGNYFSVSGRRPSDTVTLMNGVEYTASGNAVYTPSGMLGIDAVREYNVVSDTYGAQYGKRAGGQVSVVTQSGSNQIHGSVFEFVRNSYFDARNFFDPGTAPPPFERNQFGGAAGGPIRKDKTFIFGNYEQLKQRLGGSSKIFVPDDNARLGLLPCGYSTGYPACGTSAVGTLKTAANLDPRMLLYATSYWSPANGPNVGGGIATFFNNTVTRMRQDFYTTRLDHRFSDKDNFNGVFLFNDTPSQAPAANAKTASVGFKHAWVGSIGETHIFSPNVVNSFTAGLSRVSSSSISESLLPYPAGTTFVKGEEEGTGSINFGSSGSQISAGVTAASGPGGASAFFNRTLFTYSDGLQVIKGKHQISAGVWFQRVQENDFDPLRSTGQATFSNFPAMFTGIASTFTIAPNTLEFGWRTWLGAWYLQDSIQLSRNLTLRVGMRHEFSNGFNEVNGRAQVYNYVGGVIQTLPTLSHQFNTENNSKWLFAPRLGLAWDVFGNGKTSIRTAAGIYYNMVDALTYLVDVTAPLSGSLAISNVPLFSVIPLDRQAAIPPPCGPTVTGTCNIYNPKSTEPNYKVPTIQSWNFSVEQQLTRNMAMRLTYTGFQGYHEWTVLDPNTIHSQVCSSPAGCLAGGVNVSSKVPANLVLQGTTYIPAGSRPNPYLSYGIYNRSSSNQNYNALQTELVQRLAKGLQFRANYTFSKNLDINSGLVSQAYNESQTRADPYNLKLDWGPAALDVRHQASANFTYELPFGQGKSFLGGANGVVDKLVGGWQMNSILTLLSGFAMSPTIGSNVSGNGDLNGQDRPSWNPAFTGNSILGTPDQWFDPHQFISPTPGTFGNVGKGVLRTPGLQTLNLSFLKNTKITERFGLQFRAEFFNILNHANFAIPNFVVFSGANYSPSAGKVTFTTTTSRQIQFGLKLNF